MIDAVKSYVQLASGLGETSRSKAKEAAADLVALSGIEGKTKRKKTQKKIAKIAEELIDAAESNRKQVIKLIRSEVEDAVAKAEARTASELGQAQETISRMQKQLDELRGLVASGVTAATARATGGAARVAKGTKEAGEAAADEALTLMADAGQATGLTGASKPKAAPTAKRASTVKKSTAKKSTAKASTAKRSTSTRAPATKASAAKTSAAKTSAAKKSTATAPATKKATATDA